MMWTWISVVILLVGAELNAEMEHQTARDSTTGTGEADGARGAHGRHARPQPKRRAGRGAARPSTLRASSRTVRKTFRESTRPRCRPL